MTWDKTLNIILIIHYYETNTSLKVLQRTHWRYGTNKILGSSAVDGKRFLESRKRSIRGTFYRQLHLTQILREQIQLIFDL